MTINDDDYKPIIREDLIQFRRISHLPNIEIELLKKAILSTSAHVRMLVETNILDSDIGKRITNALLEISSEISLGKEILEKTHADIYDCLDKQLYKRVGEESLLARTAKSHNDQASTDLRLYLRDSALEIAEKIISVRKLLCQLAQRDLEIVMPGYTHGQPAEAILLSHWWLAIEARLYRDSCRLYDLYPRLNILPLGANVLAGTREPIDRRLVAEYLGFDDLIENSLDAVSDRDFLIEFGSFATLCGLHLSQVGSELLLWSTQEFGFLRIPSDFIILSHTLPLKRNPEILEVMRSRPSVIYGRLMEFISELKGMTIGFSQDLQECIPGVFEMVENLKLILDLVLGVLPGIDFDQTRMREVACADLVNVSNALGYLLDRGVSREIANRVVEQLGSYCRTRNKYLSDLGLNEWQQFSPAFEADIYDYIAMEESVGAFCSFGGSSKGQVEMALVRSRETITRDELRLNQRGQKYAKFLLESLG